MSLPPVPVSLPDLIPHLAQSESIHEALQPYIEYERRLRKLYAQDPENPVLADPLVNAVPIFAGHQADFKVHARDLASESEETKDKYLMPLREKERLKSGAPAVVETTKDFVKNFNLFSECSLVDLDWSNIVVAGSAAVTPLLPVGQPHNESKRALRSYYHDKLAPASDVDIFIYGLDQEQALEKILHIETKIRDSILQETTTIRTKNAITIASRYPTRHVQIVLRLYKSVSEILTGFDVDCSCVAFDGSQVYATPRAIAAFMTQVNTVDLTRRSPSYENRLSKYSHRGFEVLWPELDRSRIDPSIFERSFQRVQGLARLLVLEKLPKPQDREEYRNKRRAERNRPQGSVQSHLLLPGNVKDQQPDDVAEWVEESEVSSYHTFTIPYGPKYHAKKIEKLLFTKDLLLNAEWNRSKERKTLLHRHPAFFGQFQDITEDCCGSCPEPADKDDKAMAEAESKTFIRGKIHFRKDDPGRQEIGSFNPITDNDWTEMAYVGNTARLCQAIVDDDVEHIQDWCSQEGADVNRRDHTGRTPLQLAALCSSTEAVDCLIENGARLVARMANGFTALHLAAERGHVEIVAALLERSESNQAEEDEKEEVRKIMNHALSELGTDAANGSESDVDMISDDESLGSQDSDTMTQGSYVRVKDASDQPDDEVEAEGADVYEVDLVAWDSAVSPLHLAILGGHIEVAKLLLDTFEADALLPVKIKPYYSSNPTAALMTLVMAARFSTHPDMFCELLKHGASSSQADMAEKTVLYFLALEGCGDALDTLWKYDRVAAKAAAKHLSLGSYSWRPEIHTPLIAALRARRPEIAVKLLDMGAEPEFTYTKFSQAYLRKFSNDPRNPEHIDQRFKCEIDQPVTSAVLMDMPDVAAKLIKKGADFNTVTKQTLAKLPKDSNQLTYGVARGETGSLLDLVRHRQLYLSAMTEHIRQLIEVPEPKPLESAEVILHGLDPDSYQHWAAKTDLALAEHIHREKFNLHRDPTAGNSRVTQGKRRKLAAMENALAQFKSLEKQLLLAGAKSVGELYPSLSVDLSCIDYLAHIGKAHTGPSRLSPRFYMPDGADPNQLGYCELFQAAWTGDTERVKWLTLGPWQVDRASETADKRQPLMIATRDANGFTPFAMALTRGHYALAQVIIEIATAQYKPSDREAKYRYTIEACEDYSLAESDMSENEVLIFSHLVTDEHTIQDVIALSSTVGSTVSPLKMIGYTCEAWRLFDDMSTARIMDIDAPKKESDTKLQGHSHPENLLPQAHMARSMDNMLPGGRDHRQGKVGETLIAYAISRNDVKMLRFLIHKSKQLLRSQNTSKSVSEAFAMPAGAFAHAARLGRTEILGEMLKTTGAEMPLQKMAKKTGLELKEKSPYYQGLTVHGKKREDWAARSRGVFTRTPIEDETPPLLRAALQNNIEATEFFLGEAPLRRYEEYLSIHKDSGAVKALEQSPGGAKQALATWLGGNSQLAIHATVMGRPWECDDNAQLRYLLTQMPGSENTTTRAGRTPLHLAFRYARYSAAKLLLENGADPAICDKNGENVLHHYLDGAQARSERLGKVFAAFLALMDPDVVKQLLLKRSSFNRNAHTPLFMFLHSHWGPHSERIPTIKAAFKYTQGRDLEVMNGAGDYPLHYAVRRGMTPEAQLFVEQHPGCLRLENAVGLTPLDTATGAVLRARVAEPQAATSTYAFARHVPLTRMSAEQFMPTDGIEDERHSVEDALAMLRRMEERFPGRRRLVSLDDANEVAKRLAHNEGRRQDREDAEDELHQWDGAADGFKNYDVLRLMGQTDW